MKVLRIFIYSFILSSLLWPSSMRGQQYSSRELAAIAQLQEKEPLFQGVAVSGDIAGLLLKAFGSDFGWFEGAARVNLGDNYFPIGEVGYGFADVVGNETNISFKTQEPNFRFGIDYNFLKNKKSGKRLYGGVRYVISIFKYDVEDPAFVDPVWNEVRPFRFEGVSCTGQWFEAVFGLETKLWSIFHLGWSARFKKRLSQSKNIHGEPWYIPGFGKNGSTCWGGTFNVIFDIK